MRSLLTTLIPAAILLLLIAIAGVLSYLIVSFVSDAIPLRKIISKTTLILLVLSIFPIMSWLQLKKQDIGLSDKKTFFKQIAQGLLFGILILAPVIFSLWFLDIWHYDQDKSWTLAKILIKILGLLIIALLVSVPEEFIFRGILQTSLSKKIGIFMAIGVSAFYYAGLHYLKSKTDIPIQDLTLMSSYTLIGDAFINLFTLSNLPGLIALFSVGAFLGCVRYRISNSIGLCIGIHAGWVFLIKMTSAFFDKNRASELKFLVSDYDFIIGPFVCVWLILLTGIFLAYTRRSSNT